MKTSKIVNADEFLSEAEKVLAVKHCKHYYGCDKLNKYSDKIIQSVTREKGFIIMDFIYANDEFKELYTANISAVILWMDELPLSKISQIKL